MGTNESAADGRREAKSVSIYDVPSVFFTRLTVLFRADFSGILNRKCLRLCSERTLKVLRRWIGGTKS